MKASEPGLPSSPGTDDCMLAFGSDRLEGSTWQTQRCSPEEIRVLPAEERGVWGGGCCEAASAQRGKELMPFNQSPE